MRPHCGHVPFCYRMTMVHTSPPCAVVVLCSAVESAYQSYKVLTHMLESHPVHLTAYESTGPISSSSGVHRRSFSVFEMYTQGCMQSMTSPMAGSRASMSCVPLDDDGVCGRVGALELSRSPLIRVHDGSSHQLCLYRTSRGVSKPRR
ncbi:hypothetical protein PAXRUDRAFT_233691 [Paxillus rubicundulus Ve08.2h10]|uniref:Uncharacterized protein n=1 Tax=Paxillus rubicundulus Ve08.2h10 TaxID=930991 RepID=A0A0D0EBB3_9AGAM|nr:hypothetical protein PAXRUDRAFT_233691 [Paxillus rubicundulus Ve08.2h10]